ncbi:protein required for normal CLN1 and CLN2 G1 cyclin expression [Saccharomyces pastorianus]|uniref:Protein required for normal CLN1 and CLN2 G1 cyclin expression n=1 Tax=Saccharomyces pastorianus TaxID=27292 RepID=A0A6C1EEY7_SACPS|nr:protein required for normal CLN1 and CLN2 G1 cyclin expression [Saccharomyces pastorianus]
MANTIKVEGYPSMEWPTSLDIPLKASEELVGIDLETDLPDDPTDLKTLLVEESSEKEHWLTIALAYCNHGKTNEGIRLIEMALDVFQNSERASLHTFLTWAHLNLAKGHSLSVETKEHELTQAELNLKDAIGFDPTWIGNMLATVELYYQRGHYDKALETSDLFVKSIHAEDHRSGRQSKPNCLFLLLRAKLLYQKKNYVASLKIFQELLVINPVLQPDPRIGIGLCFWQLKDPKMAIKSWQRALQINSKNTSASILVLLGEFHNSLTDSTNDEVFKETFSKALSDLKNIFSENQNNPVLLTLLQTYHYFKGDFQTVLDIYHHKILKMSPLIAKTVLSESSFWCGRAHYALGDYRKSFIMFQESLKKNEDNLMARLGLGQTQIKSNLLEESIITFENLYKTNESLQELNYILGLLYAGKTLDVKTSKSIPAKELNKLNEKALQYLERYIKLTVAKKNQLIISRVYLVISQLYESQNQYKISLDFLSKALEEMEFVNKDEVPLEILNNLACYHFINGDLTKADNLFEQAKAKVSDMNKSVNITLEYNIARTSEKTNWEKSESIYSQITSSHPSYISARIRNLYIKFAHSKINDSEMNIEIDGLLEMNKSDLEMRSFYGWYLKNSEERKNSEKSTSHNKETLVKYNSHDAYALISLANLYVTIARDGKKSRNPKEQEKSKHSYLKAIQLYQKVLQIDPFNVFAAQGVAIIFAESKRLGPALEILRKIRDSLDNEDVQLNLAHCLLEMREFGKAIENYELVLKKFDNERTRPHILNLLGRAWYSRGMKERSVSFFQKALENAKTALELFVQQSAKNKFIHSVKFNIALLQFQIAETLRRSNPKFRTVQQIKDSLEGLEEGLALFKELNDLKEFNMIPKEELEQRIQLGETTMKSALERSLNEQEEFEKDQNAKIDEARKTLEEKEIKEQERIKQEEEAKRLILERQTKEYKRLQDEAQKLIQEREAMAVSEHDVKDDRDSDLSDKDNEYKEGKPKQKKKRSSKTKNEGEPKRRKATKKVVSDSDEDEDDIIKKSSHVKGKKSQLSSEFIEDSDEEEAQMSGSENNKKGDNNNDDNNNNNDDDNDELF